MSIPVATTELALSMAASNGLLNRTTTKEELLAAASAYLDKQPFRDVFAFEQWLRTLTPEQMSDLVDGEEGEMGAVMETAPRVNVLRVSYIIQGIYEAMNMEA